MMDGIKIALLGSHGMLGTALLHEFSSYEVVPLDRDELDITDRDEVFRVLSGFRPQIVMNAAAYTAVDDAEMNREKAFAVNGDGVSYLAEFCRENRAVFAHFSTDYVFDGNAEGHAGSAADHAGSFAPGAYNMKRNYGYAETDIPHPINVYGESKFFGEQKILESGIPFNPSSGTCGAFLIRTSWLFGPNGKNFVDTMLRLGREKKEIRVVADQIGKPTYTVDLAKATRKLIEEKMPFGIYHLVNEEPLSWYEFAREIFYEICQISDAAGFDFSDVRVIPISSDEFVRPARRPRNSILLNTKFPLLRSHSEALREYLKNM